MVVGLRKCFNGHTKERPGCAGCHHAFHVTEQGMIVEGRLHPPVVSGPDECDICHRSRHPRPVPGCTYCEAKFADTLEIAMDASAQVRQEIWSLRFMHWFLGWQAWVAGWMAMVAGGTVWDWFERLDGSFDWVKAVVAFAAVPVLQWLIKRTIRRREKLLPRLGSRGEIVYGDPDE